MHFGLLELAYSFHGRAYEKSDLKEMLFESSNTWSYTEKAEKAKEFVASPFMGFFDMMPVGFSIRLGKFGALAFGVRDHMSWYSVLGEKSIDILYNGYNSNYFDQLSIDSNGDTIGISSNPELISNMLVDAKLSFNWWREYNLSYGFELFEKDNNKLLFGFGLKKYSGFGVLDLKAEGDSLTSIAAFSPVFNLDYGNLENQNPSTIIDSSKNYYFPKPVGNGKGIDLGLTYIIDNKIRISIALNNLGNITYDGNVYDLDDTLFVSMKSSGIKSLNINEYTDELVGGDGLIKWKGNVKKIIPLPTLLRIGSSLHLNKLSIGGDIVIPMNQWSGNFDSGIIALGMDYQVLKGIRLSTGIHTGAKLGFSLPLGMTLGGPLGIWEVSISTRNILGVLGSKLSTISFSTGLLRFKF